MQLYKRDKGHQILNIFVSNALLKISLGEEFEKPLLRTRGYQKAVYPSCHSLPLLPASEKQGTSELGTDLPAALLLSSCACPRSLSIPQRADGTQQLGEGRHAGLRSWEQLQTQLSTSFLAFIITTQLAGWCFTSMQTSILGIYIILSTAALADPHQPLQNKEIFKETLKSQLFTFTTVSKCCQPLLTLMNQKC